MTSHDQLSVYNHKPVDSKDNIYKRKLWQTMESQLEINHLLMKNKQVNLYPWYRNTCVIDIKSLIYMNLSLHWVSLRWSHGPSLENIEYMSPLRKGCDLIHYNSIIYSLTIILNKHYLKIIPYFFHNEIATSF